MLILITSFVFAVVSSASKEWAYRSYFNNGDDMTLVGSQFRSPFVSCTLSPIINPDSISVLNSTATIPKGRKILNGWQEDCPRVRSPMGFCDYNEAARFPTNVTLLCHHLSTAAQLLYAGCAMTAVALLIVLVLTGVSLPSVIRTGSVRATSSSWEWARRGSKPGHHHHRKDNGDYVRPSNHSVSAYMVLLLRLLSTLGGLALFMGMIVGTTALIVLHFPTGDFLITQSGQGPTEQNHAGPWLIGRAVGWCSAASVLAWVASYAAGLVWEGPRVGVFEVHHEEDEGRGRVGETDRAVQQQEAKEERVIEEVDQK
jgi:hypothetical protein